MAVPSNRSLLPLVLLALASCSSGSGSADAGPGGVTVGSNGPSFASLQAAVDAARPGETIRVSAGTLREPLIVDKTVTIVGSGPGTRLASEVSGLAALEIRGAQDVRLEGITVSGPGDGIVVRDSRGVELENVVSSGNVGNGIDVRNSLNVTVVHGTFENNGDRGMRVREDSRSVRIERCLARNNRSGGARVRESTGVSLLDNTFSDNAEDGVEVRDSLLVEIVGNEVVANREYGIRVRSSPDLDASQLAGANTVTGNGEGQIRVEER